MPDITLRLTGPKAREWAAELEAIAEEHLGGIDLESQQAVSEEKRGGAGHRDPETTVAVVTLLLTVPPAVLATLDVLERRKTLRGLWKALKGWASKNKDPEGHAALVREDGGTRALDRIDPEEEEAAMNQRSDAENQGAQDAYKELEPILEAIPEDGLRPLRFPASEAASRGVAMAAHAVGDLPRFDEVYKRFPKAEIESLEKRALAVLGASIADGAPPLRPDFSQARSLRGRLINLLRGLGWEDEALQKELEDIERGKGHQDLADDLARLAELARDRQDMLSKAGLDVEAAAADMSRLSRDVLRWAGRKDKSSRGTRMREQRAWTYFAEAYEAVREHARVLYLDQSREFARRYPSLLYVNRRAAKKDEPGPEAPSL